VPLVYTAQSLSLASLEVLVHVEDTRLLSAMRWVAIPAEIDEGLILVPKRLPANWRRMPVPVSTRAFGDAWVAAERSAVMRVPSAVTMGEFNYLINPRHPDFRRLKIGTPQRFSFDARLR